MNYENLQQIFDNYIKKFEYINNREHDETYKWRIANRFRNVMDDALSKDGEGFAEGLDNARKLTDNIIDSYTQPFYGLVRFAHEDPKAVKELFEELYSGSFTSIETQEKKIEQFFLKSRELLDKYSPDSFRFKQNSHSVSSYLFLYDPDHNYMYKAQQALKFADCIEFYEDWGKGDCINLKVFYRMCEQVLAAILECDTLLKTDKSRFELNDGLFLDTNKHMLLFDIIYCCSTYDLYNGIAFKRPKTKEKQLMLERIAKAEVLQKEYLSAIEKQKLLDEAIDNLRKRIKVGCKLTHKLFGDAIVDSIDNKNIVLLLSESGQKKKISLPVSITKGLISSNEINEFIQKKDYMDVLSRAESVERMVGVTERELKPYMEYIE